MRRSRSRCCRIRLTPLGTFADHPLAGGASNSLFTPSGSLLATGASPLSPDAKKARTHAALAANIWSAYARAASEGAIEQSLPNASAAQLAEREHTASTTGDAVVQEDQPLKSLTLELSDHNLHIQLVTSRVLLCLIGPKTPTRHTSSSSSLHSQDADVRDALQRQTPLGSVNESTGMGGGGGRSGGASPKAGSLGHGHVGGGAGAAQAAGGSLGILKAQAQALVSYLEKELRGFELAEGI